MSGIDLARRIAVRPIRSRRRLYSWAIQTSRISLDDMEVAELEDAVAAARANMRRALCQ